MNDFDEFERRLATALVADADRSVARFEAASVAQAAIASHPRRAGRLPLRYSMTGRTFRLAAATIIGVLAAGGALFLIERGLHSNVGNPVQTPTFSPSPTGSRPSVSAHGTRQWAATGKMDNARTWHTATLLPNGTVLVAGGFDGYSSAASAELYDPGNRIWTATAGMLRPRHDHTATLLPNGNVLVAGGGDGSGPLVASAELYDPSTGAWTATGSLADARADHTATLLPNGKVLVVGGFGIRSAELYDPATGAWASAGAMIDDRAYHTATLLPDGTVLVVGGFSGGGNSGALSSAELYDPRVGTWSAVGSMAVARAGQIAALLPDGRVLVAGGSSSGSSFSPTSSAETYDPATRSWAATGTMSTVRVYAAATLLHDGTVLVTGGSSAVDVTSELPIGPVAAGDIYHPDNGTWTATGPWTALGAGTWARVYPTATLLRDGTVLVAGGKAKLGPAEAFDSAELYQP